MLLESKDSDSGPLIEPILEASNARDNDDVGLTVGERVLDSRLLVVAWTVELGMRPLEKLDKGSDKLDNNVWVKLPEEKEEEESDKNVVIVSAASELFESFRDFGPVFAEEAEVVVEIIKLDSTELKEIQLWDGSMDADTNEVDRGKPAEERREFDDSNEEDNGDVSWACTVEVKTGGFDIDELGTSWETLEYERLVSESINKEDTL